jgi:hypothetical protein
MSELAASRLGRGQVKHAEFAMASGELSRADFVTFLKTTLAQAAAVSCDGAVHYICMDCCHRSSGRRPRQIRDNAEQARNRELRRERDAKRDAGGP